MEIYIWSKVLMNYEELQLSTVKLFWYVFNSILVSDVLINDANTDTI